MHSNYYASGEDKGPVDVHFSYLNMFVRQQVDGSKNVTTPEEYYDALTRNGRREHLMANTTTMLVDVVASQMPKKTLSGQDWPTPRTMHRIEFVPLEKDAPDDATIATVSRIWLAHGAQVPKKMVMDQLCAHPNLRAESGEAR